MNRKLFGFIALAAVLVFSFAACKDSDDGGGDDLGNPFVGTWRSVDDADYTISISTTTWEVGEAKGTYTRSANRGTLTVTHFYGVSGWESVSGDYGNGTIVGDTLTIIWVIDGSTFTDIFTRQSGGDLANPLVGRWTGVGGYGDTLGLNISGTTWECSSNSGYSWKGTYTYSAGTGTLTVTHIKYGSSAWQPASGYGNGNLVGNTLTVTFVVTSEGGASTTATFIRQQ